METTITFNNKTTGAPQKCTINMYHAKCSMLLNSRNAKSFFDIITPKLCRELEQQVLSIQVLNENISKCINSSPIINIDRDKSFPVCTQAERANTEGVYEMVEEHQAIMKSLSVAVDDDDRNEEREEALDTADQEQAEQEVEQEQQIKSCGVKNVEEEKVQERK